MKNTKRKGFNFFRSYFDVFNELESEKDKLHFINALLNKQFLGIDPDDLKGMAKFAYISQCHSINSQVKGYEDKTGDILGGTHAPTQGGILGPSLQVEVEGEVKEKEKVKDIPTYEVFLIHAKSKISNISPKAVKLKYESWVENDWKTGNDKKITNWKSTLTNTVKHLETIKTQNII